MSIILEPVVFIAETIDSATNRTFFETKTIVPGRPPTRNAAGMIVAESKRVRRRPDTIYVASPAIVRPALPIVFAAVAVDFRPASTRSIVETTVSTLEAMDSTTKRNVFGLS